MKCFFKGCKLPTVIYCTCSGVTYMCASHIVFHQAYLPKLSHILFSHLKTVPIGIKSEIVSILSKIIFDLNDARTELIKFNEELNSYIMNTISSISSIRKHSKSILKDVLYGINVALPVSTNIKYTDSILNNKMINLFIKESSKNLKLNEFSERIQELNEKFKLKFKSLILTKNDKLAFFIKDTKFFVKYNTQNSVSTVKHMGQLVPQGRRAAICYVDSDKIFLYGGQSSECLYSAYFVNTKTYHIDYLISGIPRHSTTPILFNQKIYVFGGWTDKALNDCSYFDMNLRLWFTQSNLPSPQSDVSTVKLRNKILLTGYKNFLQLYYPENDTYENINCGVNPGDKNILIKYQDYVYLLAGKVYRAKHDFLVYFEHLNISVSFKMVSCRPIIRNNHAFFVDEDYQIHMFNFADFSLKMIDKVKIYSR